MNRNSFLKGIAVTGLASLLPTLKAKASKPFATTRSAHILSKSVNDIKKFYEKFPTGCILIPTETAGPFPLYAVYNNPAMIRSDITEGLGGLPLYLTLTVVNINDNCAPIENVRFYIWHCDKDGNYSGYGNFPNATFMRGIQYTNANGVCNFTTIYPGWYNGRITHIHMQLYLSDTLAATSQMAFDNTITQSVYASNPTIYTDGQNTSVAGNSTDSVFHDMTNTVNQLLTLTPIMNGNTVVGYNGSLCVGIAGCAPANPVITGNSNICEGDIQTYMVTYVNGYTYQWTVTGGNILSGQGTNAITVQWTTNGGGTINVVQSN